MKRLPAAIIVSLILISATCLIACGSAETRTNDFSVGASPAVQVEVGNGNVSLVVGQEGTITVTGELRKPDSIEYEVSQDGDVVTVEVKTRSGSRADMTVTVPANTEFEVSTGNGNIDVAGVQAPGVANVGDGDLTLSDVAGSFVLNVGNGNMTVSEAVGSFVLNDGNGDMRFQGELDSDTESFMSVGNGSVTVELSGSPSVALDLEIEEKGTIKVDLPVSASEQSDYRLVGNIGTGEASLGVTTGAGDITIK